MGLGISGGFCYRAKPVNHLAVKHAEAPKAPKGHLEWAYGSFFPIGAARCHRVGANWWSMPGPDRISASPLGVR